MTKFQQAVLNTLLLIPQDKVTTYGEIAAFLGNKSLSRAVGNALHHNPNPDLYPCYKVVSNKGYLAKNFAYGGIEEQKRRLEKDGIKVNNYQIDLNNYLFKFD